MHGGSGHDRAIRELAESIRRELKLYVRGGGSSASFLPKVKKAERLLRRSDREAARRTLEGLEAGLRGTLSTKSPSMTVPPPSRPSEEPIDWEL